MCTDCIPFKCGPGQQWECREYEQGCFACPPGTYKSTTGTERCSSCAELCLIGQQRVGCGGASSGVSCTECATTNASCADGEYFECVAGMCVSCRDVHRSCPRGWYVRGCGGGSRGECVRCSCHGELFGCGGLSAGTCEACDVCEDGSERVGCYTLGLTFHAGECRPEAVLARSLQCSVSGELAVDVGVGPPLVCTEVCDGRGVVDSQECDGPWACRTASCTEGFGAGEPHACPVLLDAAWRAGEWDSSEWEASGEAWKLDVRCQSCAECGARQLGVAAGRGWGAGCAQECSQALCDVGDLYDWTEHRCVTCGELWNASLCSEELPAGRDVTGDLLRVRFPECVPREEARRATRYGRCEVCSDTCAGAGHFPDSGCKCSPCRRAGAESRLYADSAGVLQTAYCQSGACAAGYTGLSDDGRMCGTQCQQVACQFGEVLVECLLPHNTRCVAAFPGGGGGDASGRGGNRALVGETAEAANGLEVAAPGRAHRWASFENLLVAMEARAEQRFQCVWNAAGIKDSVFAPGGVGAVFWPDKKSSAAEYRERGTKLCREWPGGRHAHPLLPLQNTVAFAGDEWRRVLVNTSARAVAYSHNGVSTLEPELVAEVLRPGFMRDVGEVLLALDLPAAAQLQLHMPRDRSVPAWAQWTRLSLLAQELSKLSAAQLAQSPGALRVAVEQLGLWPAFAGPAPVLAPEALEFEPALNTRFVSKYADMLGVRSAGWFVASNRTGDLFDCCAECVGCAALGLGNASALVAGPGDVALRFALRVANVSLLATAATPPAHPCLLLAATPAGIVCVGEGGLVFVSAEVADALVYVDDDAVLAYAGGFLRAYVVPERPCASAAAAACACAAVPLGVSASAGAQAMDVRAMAHRGGGEVLFFGRRAASAAWAVRAFGVARGPVTVNVLDAEEVCVVSDDAGAEFAPCTLATGVGLVALACGVGDEVAVRVCRAAGVVSVELTAPGWYVGVLLVGAGMLVGRGGETFWVSDHAAAVVDVGLTGTLFVRAGGGVVVFDDLVWPSEECSGGWDVQLLTAHVSCVRDVDHDGCVDGAAVARVARVHAVFEGEYVYARATLARSAIGLDGARVEWMPAQTILHRGVQRRVASWDLLPTEAGGSGWKYTMPSAVQRDGAWVPLTDTWSLLIGGRDVVFVFRRFGAVDVRCDDVVVAQTAKCSGDLFLVAWESMDQVVRVDCAGVDTWQAEVRCDVLRLRGAADLVYYSTDTAEYAAHMELATANEVAHSSGTGCGGVVVGLRWWTCPLVRSATGVRLTVVLPGNGEGAGAGDVRTIGVDEFEVQPMLSAREASVEAGGLFCTLVYIPTAAELAAAGAGAAARRDNWWRTHVLVGVFAPAACSAVARVWRQPRGAEQHDLQAAGCNASVEHAVSAGQTYGACALEVPEHALSDTRRVQVCVDGCASVERVDVSVPAALALWECDEGFFWAPDAGACVACGAECAPGTRAQACARLTGNVSCVSCGVLGAFATYVAGCEWQCVAGYWRDGDKCRPCSSPACTFAELRVPCAADADAACEACPRQANAQFVADNCSAVCDAGFFRSARGRCEACTGLEDLRAELLVTRAAGEFYRMHNCTRVSDSFAEACGVPVGGRYVADGAAFGDDCGLACDAGRHRSSDTAARTSAAPTGLLGEFEQTLPALVQWAQRTCVACAAPRGLDGTALPAAAYTMDSTCALQCVPPWLPRVQNTCVWCGASACGVGEYVSGERCDACRPCVRQHADAGFRFVSAGAVDDDASCAEQCADGMFDEFGLGVCKGFSDPTGGAGECATGEFLRAGTPYADFACVACADCAGERMTRACTKTADAECVPCAGELRLGEFWNGSTCARACRAPFVLNAASGECEYCEHVCAPGWEPARPRLNCSHCAPCAAPAASDWVWVAGCDWACAEGFVLQGTACAARASNALRAQAVALTMLCPPGTEPSGVFACKPCTETTVTPPAPQENETWAWRDTGLPCEWHCIPPLVKHQIPGGLGVVCMTWSAYRATARVVANSSGLVVVPTAPPLNTLTRWEFLVAAVCVVALVAALLIFVR